MVGSFFIYLVKNKIIDKSPLEDLHYLKRTTVFHPDHLLTTPEINELLEQIKIYSPGYLYPIIKMFAETGARTTEIVNLNWDDIDFKTRIVNF